MLTLFISWFFILWMSFAFGLSGIQALNYFRKDTRINLEKIAPDHLFLFGFLLISLLSGYLSVVMPMDAYASILFAGLATVLTIVNFSLWQELINHLRDGWKNLSLLLKVVLGVIFTTVLAAAIFQEITHVDAKLYHVQTIQWIKNFAVVPGLGNVHGRFAFNSHYFIPSALFSTHFSETRVLYPLISLFYLIIAGRLFIHIDGAFKRQKWFTVILYSTLIMWLGFQSIHRLRAISNDDFACILVFYVFLMFMEQVFEQRDKFAKILLALTVISLLTFKLSMLLLLVILPFSIGGINPRKIARLTALGLVVITPFIIRNIYLSGYVLYPAPELDLLDVDWKIPMADVVFEKALVAGWARLPNPPVEEIDAPKILELSFTEWWKEWWPRRTLRWQIIYVVNLFTFLIFLISIFKRNAKLAIVSFVLIANLVFWFIQAPDPRFAYGFLFFGFALVFAYFLSPVLARMHSPWLRFAIIIGLTAYLPLCLLTKPDVSFTRELNWSLLLYPAKHEKVETDLYPKVPFELRVPKNGKLTCFNTPIPCTPYPKPNLRMRGDRLQDGFKIIQTGNSVDATFVTPKESVEEDKNSKASR